MGDRLNCVIAEDEPHIQARIAELAEAAGLRVLAIAANGLEARRVIEKVTPDIAFIDINMPVLSGLELAGGLEDLQTPPAVIFVTAFGEHALAAFELSAIDYVVKPIDAARFAQAVQRAKSAVFGRHARAALLRLKDAIGANESEKLVFRAGSKIVSAHRSEIFRFNALDDYVEAHLQAGPFLLSLTMNALERALPTAAFIRIHRSHIVNIDHIKSADMDGKGRLRLTISDGAIIPVSRGRAATIRKLIGNRLIAK